MRTCNETFVMADETTPIADAVQPRLEKPVVLPVLADAVPIEAYSVFYVQTATDPFLKVRGLGVHGYEATTQVAKRGYGIKQVIISAKGYLNDSEDAQATLRHLYDIRAAFAEPVNETQVILDGVLHCLRLFQDAACKPIDHAQHIPPAKMVTVILPTRQLHQVLSKHLIALEQKGFVGKDGQPLPYKATLQRILELQRELEAAGKHVRYQQTIPEGSLGEEHALDNAKDAIFFGAKGGVGDGDVTISVPEGYWNYKSDRSPFLNKSKMLSITNTPRTLEGHARYLYLLEYDATAKKKEDVHKKDIEVGQYLSTTSMSVVRPKTVDPVIDQLLDLQDQVTPKGEQRLTLTYLDNVFRPGVHQKLTNTGMRFIHSTAITADLSDAQENQLTHELYPPRMAFRAWNKLQEMEHLLKDFEQARSKVPNDDWVTLPFTSNGYGCVAATDITDLFFTSETNEKGKTSYGITNAVETPNTSVVLNSFFTQAVGAPLQPLTLRLTIGMDTPKRNALAAMAGEGVKAYVLVHFETELSVAHHVVISCQEEAGIWTSPYANRTFINASSAEPTT